MLPSQLKRLLETMRAQFGAVEKAIQEHTASTNQAEETRREEWRQIPGIVSTIVDSKDKAQAESTRQEQEERKTEQQPLIDSQVRIAKWTKRACLAAVAYGAVAFWQACLMRQSIRENADGLNQTLCRMQEQINQTKRLADSTSDSIVLSQRAYLVPLGANIDNSLKAVMLSVVNIGHLPSADGTMTIFEMTFNKGTETRATVGIPIGKIVEGHWSQWTFANISYASPPMLWTPLPSYNQEDFSQQKSGVVVSGDFSYRDGFDTTPKRTTPFCYIVFYDSQRHGVNSVSCDAENMSERIKKAIGFPKNRLNSQ